MTTYAITRNLISAIGATLVGAFLGVLVLYLASVHPWWVLGWGVVTVVMMSLLIRWGGRT